MGAGNSYHAQIPGKSLVRTPVADVTDVTNGFSTGPPQKHWEKKRLALRRQLVGEKTLEQLAWRHREMSQGGLHAYVLG